MVKNLSKHESLFFHQHGSDSKSFIYPISAVMKQSEPPRISKGENDAAVIKISNMEFKVEQQ